MDITLDAPLAAVLARSARQRGLTPEALALEVLRERFPTPPLVEPRDEWERELRDMAVDCGVSLTDDQLGREVMYD